MAFYDTSFVYTGTVKSVRMPVKADCFSFTIYQDEYCAHNLDGLFYGVLYLPSVFDYEIEPSCNRIVIEIPGLTNDFFGRYYVKGEYAKVVKKFSGTYIIWKGEQYRKVRCTETVNSGYVGGYSRQVTSTHTGTELSGGSARTPSGYLLPFFGGIPAGDSFRRREKDGKADNTLSRTTNQKKR